MADKSLDLQDFLDATSDASKRTRFFMIVLVIVSVLAFVGFLNSVKSSWMLNRIRSVSDINNPYTKGKFGIEPDINDPRYVRLHSAMMRNYVENALTLRVPFFGVAFDINDLGLLSGISFITVLVLLGFSIRSENLSLKLSFKTAKILTNENNVGFETFYDLLAMKQVFIIPQTNTGEITRETHKQRGYTIAVVKFIPKLICFLPVLIYLLVAIFDFLTTDLGDLVSRERTKILLVYTPVFLLLILALAAWCFNELRNIEIIWDINWRIINEPPESNVNTINNSENDNIELSKK